MSNTDLYRVDPGLGAADALHRDDCSSVELTERQEAGVGWVMSDSIVKVNCADGNMLQKTLQWTLIFIVDATIETSHEGVSNRV